MCCRLTSLLRDKKFLINKFCEHNIVIRAQSKSIHVMQQMKQRRECMRMGAGGRKGSAERSILLPAFPWAEGLVFLDRSPLQIQRQQQRLRKKMEKTRRMAKRMKKTSPRSQVSTSRPHESMPSFDHSSPQVTKLSKPRTHKL